MTKADRNLLDYIVVCISEFANRYGMHMRDAYIYLNRYKGIEFLKEFYDVEHTLSFDDALDDLAAICRKNGGAVDGGQTNLRRVLPAVRRQGGLRDFHGHG